MHLNFLDDYIVECITTSELSRDGMVEIFEGNVRWNGQAMPIMSVGGPTPGTISGKFPDTIILIGTGNPGLCHLYKDFALSVHKTAHLPVWILGLTGFANIEDAQDDWEKIDLEMQVEMKKYVIKKFLNGIKLICVDHSTSCYIFIQLIQDASISQQIVDAFMLMPVLTLPDGLLWKFFNFAMRTRMFGIVKYFIASASVYLSQTAKQIIVKKLCEMLLCKETPDLAQHINSRTIHFYFHLATLLFEKQIDMCLLSQLSQRYQIICSNSDILLHTEIRKIAENSRNGRIVNTAHSFFVDNATKFGNDIGNWILENQMKTLSIKV